MSLNKQTEFFDKVDVSVSLAKIMFTYLERNYQSKTITEIAETTSGGTPLRGHTNYYGGKIPWIKSGELNDGIITEFEETITEEGLKKSSAKIYPNGTLVLALYGATAGKTGIVDFDTASNQAVAAIYPNAEVERDYLFWFFRQKRFDYIQMSFGAAQPNISQAVVKATKIAIPEKSVQRQVIEFLNNCERKQELIWNESVEPIKYKLKSFFTVSQKRKILLKEINQQQAYLQQLRQTILQEAVQGKLTKRDESDEPASELLKRIKAEKAKGIKEGKLKKEKELPPITAAEIPFALPNGWVWCRLEEIVSLITKGSSPKWQGVEYVKEGLLFITSENVDSYKLDLSKEKFVEWKFNEIEPRSILKKGDYLMNIVGGSIGRTAIYNLDKVANINQAVCLIRKETELINSEYLLHFFNSSVCIGYMFDKQVDNARPNLSMGNIAKFLIPLPPLAEQKRIVEKVETLMQHIRQLEQQVAASQMQAQHLLQAVLKEAFAPKKEYAINETFTLAAEE